ncbi:MAG: hypothetical protein FJ291_28775 [Planctomycetes bacterium]|nr:hypothetical protein [Planctomycetota bacterium]
MRRQIVWLITFAGGLFFLLEFLLPAKAPAWLGGFDNPLTRCRRGVSDFLIVVGTMAFLLGPINLVRAHFETLRRKAAGRAESIVFLAALAVGFLAMALRETPAKRIAAAAQKVLIEGLLPGFFNSSMALLAFYLVSSAYRAFRVNGLDSGLMMGSAAIVLLAQVPLGDWMTYALPDALQLRSLAQWILMVPNTSVQRAVLIGACGGAFAAGMRQWLGIGRRE